MGYCPLCHGYTLVGCIKHRVELFRHNGERVIDKEVTGWDPISICNDLYHQYFGDPNKSLSPEFKECGRYWVEQKSGITVFFNRV